MLQGTLDTFGLADVLALLATTAKTGRLHVSGNRGTGSVWFDGGEVVSSMAANVPLDAELIDVLFELLRYEQGTFAFNPGEVPAEPGPPQPVGSLLEQSNELLAEWRELTAVVPSLEHRASLVTDLIDDEVTLDREQWRTVLAIGPGLTVAALSDALGVGEIAVLRRVCELLDRGLLEVLEPGSGAPRSAPSYAAPVAAGDAYAWSANETAAYDSGRGSSVLEQLGGLSPRAAQAVSDVARGGSDDSLLLSFLRNDA